MKIVGTSAAAYIPANPTIERMRQAASRCKGCDLWKHATQTVFGEGGSHVRVMFIGEQPGDQEDLLGRPFVGPAGRILDKALVECGIVRSEVYVTNAVKHFKSEPRGKRRIHKKPSAREISACKPWLEAEIAALRPDVIVCLGATAAQALLGRPFRVSAARGQIVASELAPVVTATVHPSSLLRAPDRATRRLAMQQFVNDIRNVRKIMDRTRLAS